MSITGVKSYSTANLQGENTSTNNADLTARLTLDEVVITSLQQLTTGIAYTSATDLTTIDNNLTVTKNIKSVFVPIANDDVINKLYCDTKVANLVASAPATLDTLNELAVALGNDPNYATSTATLIGGKASLTATQTITGINTMNNASNVFYGDGSHLTGIVATIPSTYVDVSSVQTISGNKTFSGVTTFSDGGTNSSFIDQVSQSLNITNSMYNANITTITGVIMSSNPLTLIRTDSIVMPTVLGQVTGDNINPLYNTCYISSVTTGGIYMSSNFPTMPMDFVATSTTYPLGTMITGNIGTYFSVGTYVIANAPAGYVRFSQPLLTTIFKITVATALITLSSGIIGGALLGNVYIDYRPSLNLQINTASTVTQNAIIIKPSEIILALPTSTPYAPLGVNDLVNKTYCDSVVAGSTVCTTNTLQTITGAKYFKTVLSVSSTANNAFLKFQSDAPSATNYIQSGTTDTNGSTANLVFGSINNQTSYACFNSHGIYLQSGQGSCLYGRNDAFAFNVASTVGVTNGLYPVGYCWEILGALSTPATGSNYAGIVASPALGKGVWAISGYLVLNKGTGAYIATSRVDVLWDAVAGIRIYPASSGLRFPLITTNTTPQLIIPLGTINVVVTTQGAIQTITRSIIMTVGTATWQVSFTGVKIA